MANGFGGGYLNTGGLNPDQGKGTWEDYVRQLQFSQIANITNMNSPLYQQYANFLQKTTPGIGTMRLKSGLTTTFGSNTLQNALTNVIVTSFEKNDANPDYAQTTNTPVYFSNSGIVPVLSGQNTLMTDVGMATSHHDANRGLRAYGKSLPPGRGLAN